MKIWTCPILLLHWRNFKQILLWIPIKFVSWENLLTFMDLVFSRRLRGDTISWSFHFYWYEQVFWCLNSQLHMWIIWVNIWIPNFWHWFGFISDFSILFTNHKPCPNSSITTSPESSIKLVTPVHLGTSICSSYYGRNRDPVHSSEVNNIVSKVGSKTMGISMIIHFSGQWLPNNSVFIFIYFINYPDVACIDVKYQPIYILLREKMF